MLAFKRKYCPTFDMNQLVGYGYWRGFMKRNQHLLVSKKGKKYELNRDNWCTYTNMKAMYDHIIEEMINSNLAVKLEDPVWMNESGNHVSNENYKKAKKAGVKFLAYRCKLSTKEIKVEKKINIIDD